MKDKYSDKLFCFSPPVMLATFGIELTLAIYTVWRYKLDRIGRLGVALLTALGIFQLSEYMICGGLGLSHVEWARFGYISITLLPALGIHLITAIAGKKQRVLVGSAYASCAAFIVYYLASASSVVTKACYPNYAVFSLQPLVAHWFSIYYYAWLLVGVGLALYWSGHSADKKIALRALAAGYLVFILPTAIVNSVNPATIAGIPSIMCGFAVLFAIILSSKILPTAGSIRVAAKKSSKRTKS